MAEIIGSAAIEIKAKDKNFENEVRKIASKIKKVEVPVDAVVNTTQAKKQLEVFRSNQMGRRIRMYADVDTRKATTVLNKFVDRYAKKSINMEVKVDTKDVYDASFLIEEFEETYNNHSIHLGIEVDNSIPETIDRIQTSVDGVNNSVRDMRDNLETSAYEGAEHVIDAFDLMDASVQKIQVDVDTAKANTQLVATAALAQATRRAISAPMRMNIDKQTLDGIKGFFYTLTGGIPIDKVRTALTGLSANFEGISVKSGIVSSSVLALAGTLSHAVGDLLTIGGDVTQVVGLLNAAPAGLAAGGLALTGTILGWKGFGQALMGEGKEAAEAMKLLPPEAQKAVKALDGVGSSIRRTTQARYWKGMGTAVQDVMGAIRKDLNVGMGNAGEALGGQMSAIFGAMQEFGESGGLSNTFRDLTEFFKTSTPALAGFTSGFLDLMEGGARDMPAFGSWLSQLGTDFSAWAKNANETGVINDWIAQGAQRMKELGKVTQATYGMFSGLTSAARNAGMNGLTELASGMVDVSNAMNSREFQTGLTSFFSSVRAGAANALPGVGNFFEMIGKGLPTINTAIKDSGVITGNMFDNFTRMFDNGNMGKGFLSMLDGMKDATEILEPGFENLGNALGGLMEVSGEVLRNVAPGLNQLFETVDVVVNNMKDGIIDAMPVFNEFIQGLLAGIRSVVGPLASLAGTMLSTFASLPGPIQTAMMSIGGFLGATALINKRMPNTAKAMGTARNSVSNFVGEMRRAPLTISQAWKNPEFNSSISRAFVGPMSKAQASTTRIVQSQSRAAGQIATIWRNNAKTQQTIWQNNARAQQVITTRQLSDQVTAAKNQTSGIGGQMLPATSGRNLLGGFERIPETTKAIAKSASANLGSLGKTAGVVGGQITRGIGSALGGVMGALGGPWGLAIAGAVAGIAVLGQAQAEAKAKVEAFKETLGSMGEITTQTRDLAADTLGSSTGSWWDHFNAFMSNDAGQDVGKTLNTYDLKARDLVDGMVNGGEKASESWNKVNDAFTGLYQHQSGEDLWQSGVISNEDLKNIGITEEKFRSMSRLDLSNLSGEMTNMSDGMKKAVEQAKHLQKSFQDIASDQVKTNKDVLTSQVTSLEEKMAAFKSNMQLGGLENLSGQQGFYQLGQIADQNKNKIQEMGKVLGDSGQSLRSTFDIVGVGAGKSVAMFDMTTTSGRQMFEVMQSQADGIHAATMSTYDTILKQTGSVETATQQALATAKTETDKFVADLKSSGLEDSAIATLLDTAGLSSTDIQIALTTEGVDQAISEALRVQAALDAAASGDYTAVLNLSSDEVKSQIQSTLGLAEGFSGQEFQAKLSANFTNQAEYNTWLQDFNQATDEKKVQMIVDLENAKTAEATLEKLLGKGDQINGKTFKATAELIAKETGLPVDDLIGKLNTLPEETIKKLRLDTEGDPATQIQSLLADKEFIALLKTEVSGDPKTEIQNSVGAGVTVDVKPEVSEVPNIKSLFGFGGTGASTSVDVQTKLLPPASLPDVTVPDVTINTTANTAGADQVRSTVDSITDKNVSVTVTANESNLNSIRDTMNSLTNKTVSVNVQANESNLNSIKSSMDALTNKNVSVNVTANESNLNSIRDTMNSLTNKSVSVNVKANSGGIQQIQSAMNSLVSKNVSVNIKANTGPVNSIRAAMASIVNKNVTVAVNASAGPVNALRSAINSIANKSVTITANAPTAAVNALKTAINAVNGKTVSVTASTNTSAVHGLQSAINAVRGKTVTVTVRTRNITDNADGGMYMGGVKTFARGGFDDPRIAKAIERANRRGGSENHTAQIARGSNNYRVWGEPETGGEAYIPLALAKRARSLKILEQVAQHFGLTLERFADGGLIAGNKVSSNVTTFASGGTTKATKASSKAKEAEKKRKSDLKELNKTIKESISDLKKALSDGLTDLKSAFGQADRSPVQKALDGMRKGVRDFRSETSKQIKEAKKLGKSTKTMSAQLKASSKVDKAITKQMYSSKVWNRKGNNLEDSQYIANDAQRRQKDRRVDYNSKFTLRDYERSIGYINKELEKQQDKYDTMIKNHRSNMESISGNLFKQFDIGSLVESKDSFGYRPPTTARDISSYATKMLSDMKKFSTNLNALRKAGYNEAIINQISQMNLDEALVVSQALLSDKSKMKSINSSYTQMFGKNGDMNIGSDGSTYVGGLARSIGKNTANSMFKAGVDIQKGLVDGLTADVKALEKAGQTMSDALTKSFRKSLKIQSPSKVFRDLASFIPAGIVQGISSGQGSVDSTISNLVQPRRLNLTGSGSQSAKSSGIINGNGGTNPVTVNVYPSEGMSERQIGTTAAREIHYRLDAS